MKINLRRLMAFFPLLGISMIPQAHFAYLSQTATERPWNYTYLQLDKAHEISQGQEIIVAVIDSGVSPHPDLGGRLLPGISFTEDQNSEQEDLDGHGTAMAGLIAANSPELGIGVAPNAEVLPIRALEVNGAGKPENISAAIRWALDHDAKIINLSTGGGPNVEVRRAVDSAIDSGAIIVASSGNSPHDSVIQFPAYIENVVAVGAIDEVGDVANISVTGDRLTLTAPGTNILSTGLDGGYDIGTGTSASAAIVSGVAALVWSKYPDLSAQEVVHRLTATADDRGAPGRDPEYGFGIVDPVAALTEDVPPLAATDGPSPTVTPASGPDPNPMGRLAVTAVAVLASLLGIALVIALLIVRGRKRAR